MNPSSLITIALAMAMTQGEAAVQRAFTPPEAWVRGICSKTGADPAKAIEERNESAEAWAAFFMDLANVDQDEKFLEALDIPMPQRGAKKLPDLNINLVGIAVQAYQLFGRKATMRMLTIPQSVIAAACAKTGADVQEVMASRNAATEELLEFIESLADKHFVDPD